MKYDELIKDLRICASTFDTEPCEKCSHSNEHGDCYNGLKRSAADAIEGLLAVIQLQKEMINATAYLPLYQKPKWIPVSERLPENDKTVLVWNRRNSREYFDVYDHGRWIILGWEDITHWMPLPEPPKEET